MSDSTSGSPADLASWLARIERLEPSAIDMGLDRVREVARRIDLKLDAVVFTVGGTNGKGSTCAMLEAILLASGYRVGQYTSPHLIDFNERARVNGVPATDAELVAQFERVEAARGEISLTYFEFSTLAILGLFAGAGLDAVILEVGLGGRLDAVNIIDADCAIVTAVDIDHAEYLGDTREKIGWEKAHIFRAGRPAICSDPVPPATLVEYAASIGADLWLFGRDFNYSGDRQQWAYGGRAQRRASLAYPALRGANQLLNASGVLAALEAMRNRLPVTQQAVRQGLASVQLPGRFQVLPGRPSIVLDVGHNPHAAAHLAQNLDNMGFFPETHAVFGMLRDKDIAGVLKRLVTRVDHWYLTDLPGPRGTRAADLVTQLAALGIVNGADHKVACFETPSKACDAARESASENDRIVVFGSFLMVSDVLAARTRANRPS